MKQSRYPTVEDPVQTIAAIVEAWLTQRRAGAIAVAEIIAVRTSRSGAPLPRTLGRISG